MNKSQKHLSSVIFYFRTLCLSGLLRMIDAGDGCISSVICHRKFPMSDFCCKRSTISSCSCFTCLASATYKRTNPFPVALSSFPFMHLSRILKAIIRLTAVECKVNSCITCIEQLLNAKLTAVERILVLMKATNTLHESS